jgi:predicted O-linked N-acetylglucosamine transferase (SPINDLY family)
MKADRNAACPCGSGLKFKKCHGNPLRAPSTASAAAAAPASTRALLNPQQLFSEALDCHTGGDLHSAAALYRELLTAHPGNPDVLHNLGLVLFQQGRLAEALSNVDAAIEAAPARTAFQASRAAVLVAMGRYAEAVDIYGRLGQGLDAKSLHNLAVALGRLGRSQRALEICAQLMQQTPGDAVAHGLKGNLLTDVGDFRAAERAYREALRLRPDDAGTHSNMLLMLNYDDGLSAAELLQAHREFGVQHDGIWTALPPCFANDRDPSRQLRVGFVSPDLGEHPVGYFLEPLVSRLDRKAFELVFYATRHRQDALTERLRSSSSLWRDCAAMTDAELVTQIRQDRIDILIDLAGHTAGNRLAAMARGAAPLQLSYLGYPTTTGLQSVAYRLTDATVDPIGEDAGTETALRLPSGMFRYAPPADAPAPSAPPMLASGAATFGCFCNLSKVTASTRALWAQVLRAVPGSSLLLKAGALNDAATVERLRTDFEALGIGRERIRVMGWSDHLDHLAAYAQVDVMLDTIPFNLAGNTCEALWMGVPVVSLVADRPAGRMGASLLQAAGRSEWIAHDATQFVAIASGLVADAQRLAALRKGQRDHLRASVLLDGGTLAAEVGRELRSLFEDWARQTGPEAARPRSILHVGCGSPEAGKLPEYFSPTLWKELRLDIDPQVNPDFVASTTDMRVVPSASVQALYSSHNIEHLFVSEVPRALAEFLRVLEPGGFALVTLPDLRAAAERVLRDEQELPVYQSPAGPINALDMIYGYAPFVEGGNNFMLHKTGFTAGSLLRTLARAGFERITVKSHGFALWAVAFKPAG